MKNKYINYFFKILFITISLSIVIFHLKIIINNNCNVNRYDVNNDGNVDIKDLLVLQKYLIEKGSGD